VEEPGAKPPRGSKSVFLTTTRRTHFNMAANVHEFTDANFETDVLKSEQLVLVDFWAPWCGPCKALAPTIEALATEYAGKVRVGKLNTDNNPETASGYNISSIPTVLVMKGGQIVDKFVGLAPKERLAAALAKHLA
jgi:thioredoxin 1